MRGGSRTKVLLAILGAAAVVTIVAWLALREADRAPGPPGGARTEGSRPRLLWLVPDGLRADPKTFDVFRWAREGRMPNLKKLMDRGTHGYCRPTFPSHTPTNFATLFTGAYPRVHGIDDGPMRIEGRPLRVVSVGGFSSAARRVEPIWVTLERRAGAEVTLLAVPGSTPPELERGSTIKGRWGGWGADFHPVIFQERTSAPAGTDGTKSKLFFSGPPLAILVEKRPAHRWDCVDAGSGPPPVEATLEAWGAAIHACFHARPRTGEARGADEPTRGLDAVTFSLDRRTALATAREGEWTPWLPVVLQWKVPGAPEAVPVETKVRLRVIFLHPDGSFRILALFDQLNRHLCEPPQLAEEIARAVGPMVDFPDNFPPQLVHFPQDKEAFLDVARMSLDWIRSATSYLLDAQRPDVFIADTYTPNQMLTSRWWMGSVDPTSARYSEVSDEAREALWKEIYWLYLQVDGIIGTLLGAADAGTVVALSSDHGAIPLDRHVRLNNLFAREGLLSFTVDSATGAAVIDWENTRAVHVQMYHVFVHPGGLGGDWRRGSGAEYQSLRRRVTDLLVSLRDEDGERPVARVVEWERAREDLRLDEARVGDLVVAARPGYGWSEEVTQDLALYSVPIESGYKQAVESRDVPGLWTPFVIAGPGIRRGHDLGPEPVDMVDQYPTILRALGVEAPEFVEGRVVEQAFEDGGEVGLEKSSDGSP